MPSTKLQSTQGYVGSFQNFHEAWAALKVIGWEEQWRERAEADGRLREMIK